VFGLIRIVITDSLLAYTSQRVLTVRITINRTNILSLSGYFLIFYSFTSRLSVTSTGRMCHCLIQGDLAHN
jgi:hypothetical protein